MRTGNRGGYLTVMAHAQDGPIEWSPDRKITIEDFKAEVPAKQRQGVLERGALSFLRIEAGFVCRDTGVDGSVRAVFVPANHGGQARSRKCGTRA